MRESVPLVCALLLAGCAAAVEEPDLANEIAPIAPKPATQPVVVLDIGGQELGAFELDALCVMGGGVQLPREDGARILPGVTELVGTFRMETGTGWQLGYQVDDAEIQWLPVFPPGESTIGIRVDPASTEEKGERWTFWHQGNLPGPAAQDCYTGAIVNGWTLTLETSLD